MDLFLYFFLFIVSLSALIKSSDWFINAAEKIGLSLGVPPFVIGVTIVAFGTSLPELATSIAAVLAGDSKIVIGNVVGSNIANISLVIGIAVVFARGIQIQKSILRTDIPILIGSALLLWLTIKDQIFDLKEALFFFALLVVFLMLAIRKRGGETERYPVGISTYLILLASGVLVYLGSHFTILSIEKISELAGLSSDIIALSLVALGTSMPEVVVSVQAARKGKTEIAVGNILGSNVFNTLAVMSIPSFLGSIEIPSDVLAFSLPVMIGLTFMFALICIFNKASSWIGVFLLVFYAFYIGCLYDLIPIQI